jgi:hypothetical protein
MLEAILHRSYRRVVYSYFVKYETFGQEESKWLLAKNLSNV